MKQLLWKAYFFAALPIIYFFAPIYIFGRMIWVPSVTHIGAIPSMVVCTIFFYIAWILPFGHFELKKRILGTIGAMDYMHYQNLFFAALIISNELITREL